MRGWAERRVAIVLPLELAKAMWRRAEQWDSEKGGRFDARGAAVLVWSANALASERGEPLGGVHVRWHDPDEHSATLHRVEWSAEYHGAEAELWRALELLAGQPIRR